MIITLFVNWEDKEILSEEEMVNAIIDKAETEINDFDSNFIDYLNEEFNIRELFELTEDEQKEVKDRYCQLCVTEWLEDCARCMGYEATLVKA